jgi:hypothetical protein
MLEEGAILVGTRDVTVTLVKDGTIACRLLDLAPIAETLDELVVR